MSAAVIRRGWQASQNGCSFTWYAQYASFVQGDYHWSVWCGRMYSRPGAIIQSMIDDAPASKWRAEK